MRELRLFLRDMTNKLARDRKFQIFAKPVDVEEVRRWPRFFAFVAAVPADAALTDTLCAPSPFLSVCFHLRARSNAEPIVTA